MKSIRLVISRINLPHHDGRPRWRWCCPDRSRLPRLGACRAHPNGRPPQPTQWGDGPRQTNPRLARTTETSSGAHVQRTPHPDVASSRPARLFEPPSIDVRISVLSRTNHSVGIVAPYVALQRWLNREAVCGTLHRRVLGPSPVDVFLDVAPVAPFGRQRGAQVPPDISLSVCLIPEPPCPSTP